MRPPFDFVHLDPSQDPPEVYGAAFDLLYELWTQARAFRSSCRDDEFLVQLTSCVEMQLIAAGVLLIIKIEAFSEQ
jgi:adenosine deaminase